MTLRADKLGRLTSPELFPPGSVFNVEKQSDGALRLVGRINGTPKKFKFVRTQDGLLISSAKVTSDQITAAIRARNEGVLGFVRDCSVRF